MKKLVDLIITILIAIPLIFSPAYAGERMPEGTVLVEESYVFSVEEAQELRLQIKELEAEVAKRDGIILEYEELDRNLILQVSGLEEVISLKDLQLTEYHSMHELDLSRIQRLEKQSNMAKAEKWVFLGLGVGITIGSIIVADKIDDSVESMPIGSTTNITRSTPLFRF